MRIGKKINLPSQRKQKGQFSAFDSRSLWLPGPTANKSSLGLVTAFRILLTSATGLNNMLLTLDERLTTKPIRYCVHSTIHFRYSTITSILLGSSVPWQPAGPNDGFQGRISDRVIDLATDVLMNTSRAVSATHSANASVAAAVRAPFLLLSIYRCHTSFGDYDFEQEAKLFDMPGGLTAELCRQHMDVPQIAAVEISHLSSL